MKTKFQESKSENEIQVHFQKPEISCHIGRIGRGNARTIDLETPLSLGKYILMPPIS